MHKVNIFCKVTNNTIPEANSAETPPKNSGNTSSMSDSEIDSLSYIEFRSQSYASFYNTTLEKDKSILTLSVAGIGFLVTALSLSKSITSIHYALFIIASLLFLISIYCILTIFDKNADFIVDLVQKKDVKLKEEKLKKLDTWAIRTFYLAIIISTLLGGSLIANLLAPSAAPQVPTSIELFKL